MALFDRRLLAYFDDAGVGAGGATLLERITDYQRDLAEIERELSKYQHLLGSHQVKFRHRDRHGWIDRCNEQKTIKERYRRTVQEMVREDDRNSEFRENIGVYDEEDRERERARRKPSGKILSRQGTKDTTGRRSVDQPRLSNFEKVGGRSSLSGASGKKESVWVQIDTVTGLIHTRSSSYIVRACWQGHPSTAVDTESRPRERGDDGDDKCTVRQQLKLEVMSGARMVTVSVHRWDDRDDSINMGDTQVGEVHLDIFDSYNLQVQVHPLTKGGKPIQTAVNMRLTAPEGLLSSAEKPGARPRASTGSASVPQTQERRLSKVEETPTSDASTPAPRDGSGVPPRRRSSSQKEVKDAVEMMGAVTQDEKAVPRERLSSVDSQRGVSTGQSSGTKEVAKPTPEPKRIEDSPAPNTDGSAGHEGGESGEEDLMEELDEDADEESELEGSEEGEEDFDEEEEEEEEESPDG